MFPTTSSRIEEMGIERYALNMDSHLKFKPGRLLQLSASSQSKTQTMPSGHIVIEEDKSTFFQIY